LKVSKPYSFPILRGRLLKVAIKQEFYMKISKRGKFPILRGRLLKGLTRGEVMIVKKVSNP